MRVIRILISFVVFFLVGCQGVTGQAGYQPPVLPLKVSVDTNGEISFDIATEVEYPTPLGTFSVGVVVDPVQYFHRESTLTIRLNCEDKFYDLHGEDFSVDLESGYYEKITLVKQGSNILLELRRVGASSVVCPTPADSQVTNTDPMANSNAAETEAVASILENFPVEISQAERIRCLDYLTNEIRSETESYINQFNLGDPICIVFTFENNFNGRVYLYPRETHMSEFFPSSEASAYLTTISTFQCKEGDETLLSQPGASTYYCFENEHITMSNLCFDIVLDRTGAGEEDITKRVCTTL